MDKRERLAGLVATGHTALLLQEMQSGVIGPESGLPALAQAAAGVGIVDRVATLAGVARSIEVPVIHCTAENLPEGFGGNRNARLFVAARRAGMANLPGSDSVQPVAAVGPDPRDIILPRYHGLSPMTGSPLDSLLRNEGVSTVVVVGVSLNVAIPNLVFDAVNRSYQVVVVSDAVAGIPVEYGEQVVAHTLAAIATVCTTDELVDAWAGSSSDDD
jgi:biuret amidohydrolase